MKLPTILLLTISAPVFANSVIYVDNRMGSDTYNGRESKPQSAQAGPFHSIQKAFASVKPGDSIEIANTGIPYPGGNVLMRSSGTSDHPLVINGNGATISGLQVIAPSAWRQVERDIFACAFWPMSNYLKIDRNFMRWIGSPKIWRVNGAAAQNCSSLEELRATPGGFFWNKQMKEAWFHLPQGKSLEDLEIAIPVLGTGLNVHSPADYVVVKNLRSEFSSNDGFSAHLKVTSLRFENCVAVDNCGQGFSMHDSVQATVQDSYAIRNASSGACDVHESQVAYERCVFIDNSFEAGTFAKDKAHIRYEGCLIANNQPFEQIWQIGESQMEFTNCVIVGRGEAQRALMKIENGKVDITGSALFGASRVADISGLGSLDLTNCLLGMELPAASEKLRLTNTVSKHDTLPAWIGRADFEELLNAVATAGGPELPKRDLKNFLRETEVAVVPQ